DPRHLAQATGRGRLAELGRRPYSERARDLHRLAGADPEVAAEPDEVRLHLALELLELRDLPGLDELLQAALDPPADPAQLAHAARADQVGRAPVRTRRVGIRARQLEQRRERLEPLRDRLVVEVLLQGHGGSVTRRWQT